MRKYLAATAALSTVLLLGACSDTGQAGDGATTAASPEATATTAEATPDATTGASEPIDTAETCAGYYDGDEYSVDHRVTTWGPKLGAELDEEGVTEVTVIRDRLNSLLRYANEETTPVLQTLQVPFENALSGTAGDPDAVKRAAGDLEALCEEAGFDIPS